MKKDTYFLIMKKDSANGKKTILPQWYKTKKDAQKSADDLTRYFHYYFSFEIIPSDSVDINKMKGEMKKMKNRVMTVLLEYFNKFQNEPNLYNWTEYRAKHHELEKLVGDMRKNNLITYTMYDNCIKALTRNYNQAVRLYNCTMKGY